MLAQTIGAVETVLEELIQYTDENFMPKVKGFQQYYNEVKLLCDNLSNISATLLKAEGVHKVGLTYSKSSEACSLYFNKLIEDFQFHDIIYQKLEHLKIMNGSLLRELELLTKGTSRLDSLRYTSTIKEMCWFYLEQLSLIKQEYTVSFRGIKEHLSQIREEVEEVQQVVWQHGESAFFLGKQVLDLPDHIIKCSELAVELGNKISEIETATEFTGRLILVENQLKSLLPEVERLKELNSLEERIATLTKISEIFTMESERELWYKVLEKAGIHLVQDRSLDEDAESSSVDLF